MTLRIKLSALVLCLLPAVLRAQGLGALRRVSRQSKGEGHLRSDEIAAAKGDGLGGCLATQFEIAAQYFLQR